MKERLIEIQARVEMEPELCIAELQDIVESDSKDLAAWVLKACIHFDRDEHVESIEAFAKIIEIKPRSEKASLGLFHSFWSAGDTNSAFEEIKRYFLAVGVKSETQTAQEYRAIVKDINKP